MKFIDKTWVQILIVTILLVPTFFVLLKPGFFPMQDDLQAFRVLEMSKCLSDFQIPCYWIPDMGYQYGYPQFLFYSPSIYYMGALLHLVGIQVIDAVKVLFILGFIFGGLSMFGFLRSLLGKYPAFFGALLYSYVPFKAAQVYVRGSLSEFWAAIFFPLLFWFSMELIKSGKRNYGIFFALSLGGLLITHNLMSLIFLPILGVWILVWLYLTNWKFFYHLLFAGLIGIGISGFFILPLLAERSLVHTESLLGGYFDYRQHFVNLNQLFLSNYWGYGSSVLGDNDEVTLSVGILQWVFAFAGLLAMFFFGRKDKKLLVLAGVLAVMEFGVLFLMHQKSSFIWSLLPVLSWLQFPWRFLAVSSFLLTVLGSLLIYVLVNLKKTKFVYLIITLATLLLFTLYGSFFTPREWFYISDQDKFSGESWEKQLTISIFDYLPKTAVLPPNKKAPEIPEILDGEARFSNYKKFSDYQIGKIAVSSEKATIRFPIYDFYGMKLSVDGVEKPFWSNDCRGEEFCFGLITTEINEGTHVVTVGLTRTHDRTAGNLISIVSIILLFVYLRWRDKKNA